MKKHFALAAVATAVVASPAFASTTIDFTGAGFSSSAPYSTVSGSFDYNFDATSGALTITNASATLGTGASSTTLTSLPVSIKPDPYGVTDPITIGALTFTGTDSFELTNFSFNTATGTFRTTYAVVEITDGVNAVYSGGLTSFEAASAAVPEPATWAMMLLGFGGIGFAMRRKRSQALATG